MYYQVKVRFDVEQDNGKTKKVRELHLVDAISVGEAESKAVKRFGGGISPCFIEAVQESKIVSVLED